MTELEDDRINKLLIFKLYVQSEEAEKADGRYPLISHTLYEISVTLDELNMTGKCYDFDSMFARLEPP